ncbi:hypothetical protein D3C86_1939000 [compost metagenome]
MIDMDVQNGRIRHRLGVIVAGRLRHEAFISHYYLIFGKEKHILLISRLFIDIVGPEHAIEDETQVFANVFVFVIEFTLAVLPFLPVGQR